MTTSAHIWVKSWLFVRVRLNDNKTCPISISMCTHLDGNINDHFDRTSVTQDARRPLHLRKTNMKLDLNWVVRAENRHTGPTWTVTRTCRTDTKRVVQNHDSSTYILSDLIKCPIFRLWSCITTVLQMPLEQRKQTLSSVIPMSIQFINKT